MEPPVSASLRIPQDGTTYYSRQCDGIKVEGTVTCAYQVVRGGVPVSEEVQALLRDYRSDGLYIECSADCNVFAELETYKSAATCSTSYLRYADGCPAFFGGSIDRSLLIRIERSSVPQNLEEACINHGFTADYICSSEYRSSIRREFPGYCCEQPDLVDSVQKDISVPISVPISEPK